MHGFLSTFADKAQSAINATPLAGHLPNVGNAGRPSSADPAAQPSTTETTKSHALGNLSYQFRSMQQQFSTTSPVQRLITLEKGLAINFDNVSRDSKAQSKELYTWGQSEAEDIKDVADRLAYLNFVEGSLAGSLSVKLDSARAPFKALRDAEANLQPKRNIRSGIQMQISRYEHDQKGNEKKIADLREQLKRAEAEDQQLEKDVEILKRKAIRESEQIKWDATREYGEKLVLLSKAATPIIAALPAIPPTTTSPYTGHQTTGAVRASLQRALDNYKTGHINLPPHSAVADLSRSDTQSFGESHASELSSIAPSPHTTTGEAANPQAQSVIDPQVLNQSPAPIPPAPAAAAPVAAPVAAVANVDPSKSANTLPPAVTPTIAETGLPVSAGPQGPGPVSGSLHEIHAATPAAPVAATGPPKHETAEEEKKRLAALYSPPVQSTSAKNTTSTPPPVTAAAQTSSSSTTAQPQRHETAEEEKKRLEREERQRLLLGDAHPPDGSPHDDEDLPPYQEPGL